MSLCNNDICSDILTYVHISIFAYNKFNKLIEIICRLINKFVLYIDENIQNSYSKTVRVKMG